MDDTTGSVPVGTIVAMIGINPQSPPQNWLWCDGTTSIAHYPELAAILPGQTTTPNLLGYVLIAADDNNYKHGQTYGSPTHTLAIEEMPSHQHFGALAFSYIWTNTPPKGPFGQTTNSVPPSGLWYSNPNNTPDGQWAYIGSTFSGGTGTDPIATSNGNTYGKQGPSNSFGLMQPSYAVYYMIYAGRYSP